MSNSNHPHSASLLIADYFNWSEIQLKFDQVAILSQAYPSIQLSIWDHTDATDDADDVQLQLLMRVD